MPESLSLSTENSQQSVSLSLDALLLVLILLLMSPRLTRLTLHEWIGTGLLVPLLVHLLLSWRWIAKVADRFIPGPLKEL